MPAFEGEFVGPFPVQVVQSEVCGRHRGKSGAGADLLEVFHVRGLAFLALANEGFDVHQNHIGITD